MGKNQSLNEQKRTRLLACYNWLLKGNQRGKILVVLESAMITSRIKNVLRKRFSGNHITQRSVGRIINNLVKMNLVRRISRHKIDGLGKLYEVTGFGKEMQELLRQNEYRGIW